jgi:hypothetical protein
MKQARSTAMSLLLAILLFSFAAARADGKPCDIARSQFPNGFLFGAASSAYQVSSGPIWRTAYWKGSTQRWCCFVALVQYEGAVREGGRGPSIWDAFTHNHPGNYIYSCTGLYTKWTLRLATVICNRTSLISPFRQDSKSEHRRRSNRFLPPVQGKLT